MYMCILYMYIYIYTHSLARMHAHSSASTAKDVGQIAESTHMRVRFWHMLTQTPKYMAGNQENLGTIHV